MDWARFDFDWRPLDYRVLRRSLIEIEAHRQSADHLLLPAEWREQLDRLNRVRAVHGTTAIEGNPLTEAETGRQLDLLDQEAPAPAGSEPHRQVRNASRAQDWVKERFASEGSAPLRLADLRRMHELLTAGSDERENTPGKLRTHRVQVGAPELGGVHRGAPPERLAELLGGFVAFMESRRLLDEHPAVQALLGHFFLVTIHPFGDGNGRVSRLLEAGVLYRNRYNVHGFYGLSNHFYRHADDYRTLLQRSRRTQPFDLQDFVVFGLWGFVAELNGINAFVKAKTNRMFYRNTIESAARQRESARRRVLNPRERALLVFLLDETEPDDPFGETPPRQIRVADLVAHPYIQGLYREVTHRTFVRELIRLMEKGFLTVGGEGPERSLEIDFRAIGKY